MEIDPTSLSRVFSAPMWLRDLGLLAWFLVGVGILLVGSVWLLALTSTITEPVLVGAILATVASPLVSKMQQLTDEEFEGVLRPAFQQDEWKLIAVGAALGFLVGELQVYVMLHMGH